MEKAYDLKVLVEKFKAIGLDIAEESAEKAVIVLFDWLDESADLSENIYDNLLKAVYPMAKAEILKKVEEISPN